MRRTALAFVLAAAFSAVADAATATGLHGVVMRGPTKPVCSVGEQCLAPARLVTLVFARNGVAVARTKTTRRGTYRVVLRAGVYTVRTLAAARIGGRIEPVRVRVVAGRMRLVDFTIDTGIR